MIKCIECGKLIEDGDTRYVALHGSYCRGCWEKKDQKFKDGVLIRAKYGLNGFAKVVRDIKKGGDR